MLANSLTVSAHAEIWTPPATGNATGTFVGALQVVNGSVTIDGTNAIRRSCSAVTLIPYPDDTGQDNIITVPSFDSGALFPAGNEVKLFKGIRYADGTTEEVPLGRFLIEDLEVYREDTPGTYVQINGRDRGGTISRAKFTAPFSTALFTISGLTLDKQLQALINFQVPNLTYNITPTTHVPAAMAFAIGDDPWASALALAAAGGYELFPDATGVIVARPTVNPINTSPSATYASGPDGIVTKIQRSLINTTVPNVIVVESQGSGVTTPLVSYWWDSAVGSTTYYNATVPTPGSNMHSLPTRDPAATYPVTVATISTQAARTQTQCDDIALSAGYATIGTIDTFDVKIRDNPAHDVDDVLVLQDPEVWPNPTLYVVDKVIVQIDIAQELEIQGRLVVL